jgi:hypothetical protein
MCAKLDKNLENPNIFLLNRCYTRCFSGSFVMQELQGGDDFLSCK